MSYKKIFLKGVIIFTLLITNVIFSQTLSGIDLTETKVSKSIQGNNVIKTIGDIRGDNDANAIILKKSPAASVSCGKVYASSWSTGRNSIYELNGSNMTPVFTAPQIIGGLAISANGNAYYDNGTFVGSPLYSSDFTTQVNTGSIISLFVGEAADAIGNVYFIDSNLHLRKINFGSSSIATDLGALVFDSGDAIGPTLAYGDMAFDGNGRLFWYSSISGFGQSYLYFIDTLSLKTLSLGNVGPDAATGLAFDATGKLITTSNGGATIISVDLSQPALGGTAIGTADPTVFDLGSCVMPLFNPILTVTKSVANITSGINPATVAQVGDVLEYTIVVKNSGNLISNNSLLADAIPASTRYVSNSTTINGSPFADIAGNMPFITPTEINSPLQLPGIIAAGSTSIITFRVIIDSAPIGSISNTATVNYPIVTGGITTIQTINSNTVIVLVPKTILLNTDILVYNHMTPNDDGDNEFFFIEGIDKYPDNTVEIYNRWGILVYEVSSYNNKDKSFKGISDGRVTVNRLENLPEGTYYYVLRYNKSTGESKEKSGYLYINR